MNESSYRRWSVVLSGGEGTRMRDWIARRTGRPAPKQYCAFTGGRTMLEHTLDRAVALSGEDSVLTLIAEHHWEHLERPRRLSLPGSVFAQPKNRGTAAGVLLPLTQILARDPGATVAILPSDHFISSNERFTAAMQAALRLAERQTDKVILLGARPDRAETDYGWIRPEGHVFVDGTPAARTVKRFVEKPNSVEAEALHKEKSLWNTMIVAAKARTLWEMGRAAVPGIAARLESVRAAFGSPEAGAALDEAYLDMPEADFSRDMLGMFPERLLVVPMNGVEWCDWGRPERVVKSLEALAAKKAQLKVPVHSPVFNAVMA